MQPPDDAALREAVRIRMSPPNRESVAQIARDTARLKTQLSAQADSLQQAQKAHDEHAARMKSLEAEMVSLRANQSSIAAGLQRLRHVARPAGHPAS